MPVDVIVKRIDSVPYKHEDVVDALLSNSEAAAVARGSSVLDEEGSGNQIITLETEFRVGLRNGAVAEIRDALTGQIWRGKIVSVEHRGDRGTDNGALVVTTILKIKKPSKFYTLEQS